MALLRPRPAGQNVHPLLPPCTTQAAPAAARLLAPVPGVACAAGGFPAQAAALFCILHTIHHFNHIAGHERVVRYDAPQPGGAVSCRSTAASGLSSRGQQLGIRGHQHLGFPRMQVQCNLRRKVEQLGGQGAQQGSASQQASRIRNTPGQAGYRPQGTPMAGWPTSGKASVCCRLYTEGARYELLGARALDLSTAMGSERPSVPAMHVGPAELWAHPREGRHAGAGAISHLTQRTTPQQQHTVRTSVAALRTVGKHSHGPAVGQPAAKQLQQCQRLHLHSRFLATA